MEFVFDMKPESRDEILAQLDRERQSIVFPGVSRMAENGVVKDSYDDGKSCEIVYSHSAEADVDEMIDREIRTAREARMELEWKVYGHDKPPCLSKCLASAGFAVGDMEAFMVAPATEQTLARFDNCTGDVRRLTDDNGMADVRSIMEEVRGSRCEDEVKQYATMLKRYPDNISVYVAYVEGEPAAYGRVYFHRDSQFAAMYGGQTREKFRRQGLFTSVVAARIREAIDRGAAYICVDALPTSEPILKKRGFEIVTYTQPYTLR